MAVAFCAADLTLRLVCCSHVETLEVRAEDSSSPTIYNNHEL